MADMLTALDHVREALELLSGEAHTIAVDKYGIPLDEERPSRPLNDFCVIAQELDRIDSALAPKGRSMFAPMSECVAAAYTELLAAKKLLENPNG